jgi:hypothetical protein
MGTKISITIYGSSTILFFNTYSAFTLWIVVYFIQFIWGFAIWNWNLIYFIYPKSVIIAALFHISIIKSYFNQMTIFKGRFYRNWRWLRYMYGQNWGSSKAEMRSPILQRMYWRIFQGKVFVIQLFLHLKYFVLFLFFFSKKLNEHLTSKRIFALRIFEG